MLLLGILIFAASVGGQRGEAVRAFAVGENAAAFGGLGGGDTEVVVAAFVAVGKEETVLAEVHISDGKQTGDRNRFDALPRIVGADTVVHGESDRLVVEVGEVCVDNFLFGIAFFVQGAAEVILYADVRKVGRVDFYESRFGGIPKTNPIDAAMIGGEGNGEAAALTFTNFVERRQAVFGKEDGEVLPRFEGEDFTNVGIAVQKGKAGDGENRVRQIKAAGIVKIDDGRFIDGDVVFGGKGFGIYLRIQREEDGEKSK